MEISVTSFMNENPTVWLIAQSYPTLCDPMAIAHQVPLSIGILQQRILEWVAMPSSRGTFQPRY